MNAKIVVFLAVVAVAVCSPAEETAKDKRALVGLAYPGAAVAAPLAYPYGAALPYSAYPYNAYPYASLAYPYAGLPRLPLVHSYAPAATILG
ncbi:Hypothetical predicted protein [Cloeon dipterum]|uniref:Uncharacterized protein n=1 Tax=Cloeon dipterum TaxID=197152 RepID=A0A8S1CIF2_9INSE|nr:Hypothetical predicted protein [Cloeon dipterum]